MQCTQVVNLIYKVKEGSASVMDIKRLLNSYDIGNYILLGITPNSLPNTYYKQVGTRNL